MFAGDLWMLKRCQSVPRIFTGAIYPPVIPDCILNNALDSTKPILTVVGSLWAVGEIGPRLISSQGGMGRCAIRSVQALLIGSGVAALQSG